MSAALHGEERTRREVLQIAERMMLGARLKVLGLPGSVDPGEAVDVALLLTERLFDDAGVTVVRRVERSACLVRTSTGRLEQALVNVLLNACEATPRKGTVTVSCRIDRDTGRVRIEIADAGDGIAPEALERVFEPFYGTRGRLGLGLSVARDIVEGLDGSIEIESRPGRGTRVVFLVPASPREAQRLPHRNRLPAMGPMQIEPKYPFADAFLPAW
jgi:signal transduction histidine kinase